MAERIFGSLLGTMEVFTIYLGERLGLYAALVEGPSTPGELAARASIAERYAREWLEQQAVNGFLEVDDVAAAADARRNTLPPEHAEVLVDRDALTYLTPQARMSVAIAQQMPALMSAYRSGGGVNWRDFGPDMSEGQELGNRPAFLAMMESWVPQGLPDVHERLSAGGRVADVGCGGGWSSIAIAQAYEGVSVDGYDLDEPAVERARQKPRRTISPIGFGSMRSIRPRWTTARAMTSCARSSASTTCRSPCPCCARCVRWRVTAAA